MNRKGPKAVTMQVGLTLVLLLWTSPAASGQTNENTQTATKAAISSEKSRKPKTATMPALQNYKDIKIGSTADEVRDKLGKAVIDDKDGFYYEFDDAERVQIQLDADKKIRLISVTYTSESKKSPKLETRSLPRSWLLVRLFAHRGRKTVGDGDDAETVKKRRDR